MPSVLLKIEEQKLEFRERDVMRRVLALAVLAFCLGSGAMAQTPPEIVRPPLPKLLSGVAFSATFTVAPGTGTPNYRWSVSSGGVPRGLTLSQAGVYSGTPTDPGVYQFTVRVTDGQNRSATQVIRHNVAAGPPTVVPGFDNNIYGIPGSVLYRRQGVGRITNFIYHNGEMFSSLVGGGGGTRWRWTNRNDITSIVTSSVLVPTSQGTHAHVKVGEWVGGFYFPLFRSAAANELTGTVGQNTPRGSGEPRMPVDTGGGHKHFWPWVVSFQWPQYNSNETGVAVLGRLNQNIVSWPALADTGVLSNAILLGNRMFITSDETAQGITSWDLDPAFETPPRPPALLSKLSGEFGAYISVPWRDKIILARGDRIEVVDISDPADLKLTTTIRVPRTANWHPSQSVPYVQCQMSLCLRGRPSSTWKHSNLCLSLTRPGLAGRAQIRSRWKPAST